MSLDRELRTILQKSVDRGELAGAVALMYRDGQTQCAFAGWSDIEEHMPIRSDSIFRIASMTKPITSVAALMLVDEGRIRLEEPITTVAPEFSDMKVLRSVDGSLEDTEDACRVITFLDLLTHRAGLTYADFHRGPIAQAYREALGYEIDSHLTPEEWIRNLAGLPLIAHPGTAMTYGTAADLLGFLVARIEGEPLGAVLARRIFDPLGMTDTGFSVSREKRNRCAAAYSFDEHGRLVKCYSREGVFVEDRPEHMTFESGGAGLWSTVDDYLRFARVFLGYGEVDGVRLLRPESLARMVTNQLTQNQRVHPAWMSFGNERGFGLGVSLILEPSDSDLARRGGKGTVSWPGAFGGWWQADPKGNSAFVFLAHNMVDLAQMAKGIGLGVWSTIADAQRLAVAGVAPPQA
jgi:CubicO group peptidase (beta-lactamase class C family)